ncbi:MAG: cytochrome c4 [Zoogloeaceae bacterium]|jgi:cytochrome c553|nr:cytochrome c4 [Zoogloeaceae bacterium]
MIRTLVLAAFLTASFNVAAQGAPKADPEKGKVFAETICVACHGVDGTSPLANFPHIAGQSPEYLKKQFEHFKKGLRTEPQMTAMAATVPDEEVANVAAWFAQQQIKTPATPAPDKSAEVIARGQKLWRAGDLAKGIPACAACHGASGHGLPVQYPRLAGQFPEYIELQLKNFRNEIRTNDPEGMMQAIAAKLSDKEIEAVSHYAAGLR